MRIHEWTISSIRLSKKRTTSTSFIPAVCATNSKLYKSSQHLSVFERTSSRLYSTKKVDLEMRCCHSTPTRLGDSNNRCDLDVLTFLGSTGLPKPIYQPQKKALANYAISMEMKAFITLPLYHNHGICNFFRAIYSNKSIHIYNADLPLTQSYLTTILRKHNFEIFYGVPYALKLLAETDEGIELLRQLKIVMYGGSACPDTLGDLLVEQGINLVGHYGA
jgi:acyl-CoA synthetase (AMP-forming)/AMP-acid ligase II